MESKSRLSILIADDEPEIRNGLSRGIDWSALGLELVGTAADGVQALEQIHALHPDICITDIKMPHWDGLEVVRACNAEAIRCRFILLSGFSDFKYAQQAIQYQVSDYLLKPIVLAELEQSLLSLAKDIRRQKTENLARISNQKNLREARLAAFRQQFVRQVLHQEIMPAEFAAQRVEYDLPLRDTESCAVLLKCEFPPQAVEGSESLLALTESVYKALDAALLGCAAITTLQGESRIAIVCNLPLNAQNPDLLEFLQRFIERVSREIPVRLNAAVGDASPYLLSLYSSYKIALKALTWSIYFSEPTVLTAAVLQGPPPPKNLVSALNSAALFDAMLRRDGAGAKAELDRLFHTALYCPTPPPNYLFGICSYLLMDLHQRLAQHLSAPLQSYPSDTYEILSSLANVQMIRDWMQTILSDLMNELQVRSSQTADPIIQAAMEYVQHNIDKMVRVEDISSHVGLSKSYFTAYFKNKTQINFRDYILDLKIDYAREQLRHPEHTPSELAVTLGYEDYRSFNRAFKARTGLAPTDYQRKYVKR